MTNVDDALDRAERGLIATRDFLNTLPLNDGASRRAIDREYVGVKLIPDGLVALATVREALERQREERDMSVNLLEGMQTVAEGWKRDCLEAQAEVRRLTEGLRAVKATGFDYAHDPHGDLAREAGQIIDALLSASPSDGGGATGPSFIPRDTDEYPSDAMPSSGHSDWREEAEWWQRTCEYWRARALGEPLPDGGGAK